MSADDTKPDVSEPVQMQEVKERSDEVLERGRDLLDEVNRLQREQRSQPRFVEAMQLWHTQVMAEVEAIGSV
jgi:hypothetical protein